MSGNTTTDDGRTVYDQMDDEWTESPAKQEAEHTPIVDDGDTDSDSNVAVTDGESHPQAAQEKVPVHSPPGQDISPEMTIIQADEDLRPGDDVVVALGGNVAGTVNDAKTATGVGQEFGAGWGQGYMEMVYAGDCLALQRPDGQTQVGRERMAGREQELATIRQQTYYAATEGTDFVIDAKRESIERRETRRAQQSRETLRGFIGAERRVSPAFNRFDDDQRAQAKSDAMKHRVYHPRHLEDLGVTPGLQKRVSADPTDDETDRTYGWDRWADDTARRMTPAQTVESPAPPIDPDDDELFRIIDSFLQLNARYGDADADDSAMDPTAGRVALPAYQDLNLQMRDVHRALRVARREADTRLKKMMTMTETLFHAETYPFEEISPDWPAVTTKGRVIEAFDPAHKSQSQVVRVEDIHPTKDDTAKVTVWKASQIETDMEEGDIVRLSNVRPSIYVTGGDAQLTLAVLSDSSIDRLHRAHTEVPDPTTGTGRTESIEWCGTPQNLAALETTSGSSIDYEESGVPPLSVKRYRRPELTYIKDLGWDETCYVDGSEANRNPMNTVAGEVHRVQDMPTAQVTLDMVRNRFPETDGHWGDADPETEGVAINRREFALELATSDWDFERLEAHQAEAVFQLEVAPHLAIRVYSTVVGQWTVPETDADIEITFADAEAGAEITIDRIPRDAEWKTNLHTAVAAVLAPFA